MLFNCMIRIITLDVLKKSSFQHKVLITCALYKSHISFLCKYMLLTSFKYWNSYFPWGTILAWKLIAISYYLSEPSYIIWQWSIFLSQLWMRPLSCFFCLILLLWSFPLPCCITCSHWMLLYCILTSIILSIYI